MDRHTRPRSMTVDDLYAMPDDGLKHELQAGLLVAEPLPGSRHGRVAARVTADGHTDPLVLRGRGRRTDRGRFC